MYSIPLTTTAREKCERLVLLGRKVFQTRMAAVTLLDEQFEVYKAEQGLDGVTTVPRCDSLAAHVVLADEAVVILDTKNVS